MQRWWTSFIVLTELFVATVTFAQVTTSKPFKLTMNMVMTSSELQETGVAGLRVSQRKALDEWLNRYTMRVLAFATGMVPFR